MQVTVDYILVNSWVRQGDCATFLFGMIARHFNNRADRREAPVQIAVDYILVTSERCASFSQGDCAKFSFRLIARHFFDQDFRAARSIFLFLTSISALFSNHILLLYAEGILLPCFYLLYAEHPT